ncbi:MAG TPA: hypothetical protein PKD61_02620 [Polyangiaceae bacterium]|nr:hypothetical protein [Polyangiaceae bacterium]
MDEFAEYTPSAWVTDGLLIARHRRGQRTRTRGGAPVILALALTCASWVDIGVSTSAEGADSLVLRERATHTHSADDVPDGYWPRILGRMASFELLDDDEDVDVDPL